jgi:hypothetical protein
MIGGGFLDKLKSNLGWLASKVHGALPYVRQGLQAVPHPVAQTAGDVLKTLGYGVSGGNRKKIDNRLS